MAGYILTVFVVPLMGILVYASNAEYVRIADLRKQARETIVRLDAVLSDLKDVEVGQLGYVLTGRQEDRKPYDEGKAAVFQSLTKVRDIAAGAPEFVPKLDLLKTEIEALLADLDKGIDEPGSPQDGLAKAKREIEAAKAGEQGKGFGVVAQEVKSLAGQSKQATAAVRTILSDIQGATVAAVMATEQSGKAVESGLKQSSEAAHSVRTLSDCINESTQAAVQIAASNEQQLVGMDQLAHAMENIKMASDQNVSSTRQTKEAARQLIDLAEQLKRLVSGGGQ